MRPEDVGVAATTLVLGKHSGRHAVQTRCEQMGIVPSRFELDQIYRRMIALADAHKTVTDAELRAIVDQVRATEAAGGPAPTAANPAAPRPARPATTLPAVADSCGTLGR
jgi:isopropylmalate/homocitrate/citramalate synthase